MRVALLAGNAPRHNAVGNQIAEKVRFFQERGAEVRLFVQDARRLHVDLRSCCAEVPKPSAAGPVWDYLRQADLVIAVYAQYFDLLQYLPALAGMGPRIVFEYLGVTPADLWHLPHCEELRSSAQKRGYVWCADHVLVASEASRHELVATTGFLAEHVTTLPLVVDTQRFHPEPQENYWQQKLGVAGRVLLYVGRVAGNKRVPLLIEALARLGDPSIHAAIAGDVHDVYAEEAARCQELAQQVGVAERVHFTGPLDDAELPRAYRGAAVLVMPSLHEGFCVPVIEAMASGLPVIASRSEALPETVSDAGLTFVPNDVTDLVRQLRRVLDDPPPHRRADGSRRVAIVGFRFGPAIVGGAETSLRTMAKALQQAGQHVEVFTTCTISESNWQNDLPAGTVTLDGLTVHRFPIDAHDPAVHDETVRTILEADGAVAPALEQRYVAHSIHSSGLIEALRRRADFDAIITGPYLFGLTADIAAEFPGKTLVVPCFHDEPLARLKLWPTLYGNVGGVLYHSAEEQDFAQQKLGVNHPNSRTIGTSIAIGAQAAPPCNVANLPRPYVVYCGRYSAQKQVPLLLDWMARFQAVWPGRLDIVFMGEGEVALPRISWLHNRGHVDEATKRSVLAGAVALVQLSRQESLSLVVLEAWAEGTPVIVHGDCAVLAGQVERSGGGVAITDYASFVDALSGVLQDSAAWQERGVQGRAYVATHYACAKKYVDRLMSAIEQMGTPTAAQMRERGLRRAALFARERWQERFAEFIEQRLTQPARICNEVLRIEPLRSECRAAAGVRTLLLPVRFANAGTHAVVPDGPGSTMVCCEIREATGRIAVEREEMRFPTLLMPGQSQAAALPIALPIGTGSYRIFLWLEHFGRASTEAVEIALTIGAEERGKSGLCASSFLDTVQATLPRTHQLQQLPSDYVDVSEGRLAPLKRLVKRKLLNNFKHAYVDALSRQQSQVNGQVVLMIQQLAECCAMLDHAVAGLHERLDGLEAKMERWMPSPDALATTVDDRV